MKKILVLLCALLIGISAKADVIFVETNVNMQNFWDKNGREVAKITEVANKLTLANGLKRAPINVYRVYRIKNAFSDNFTKNIYIYAGMLPYINNDDEAAALIGHELAHANEAYDGFLKISAMSLNKKKYEYKADLLSVDYMVKAGYNPISAIIFMNRICDEPLWDWGFLSSHPKGSKRMLKMYEHISVKYPQYLNSSMTKEPEYQSFLNQFDFQIKKIDQKRKTRQLKQNEDI